MDDELAQKGVVVRSDFGTSTDPAVPPDPRSRGCLEVVDAPCRWKKTAGGVLTRDATFDGVPRKPDVFLAEVQGLSERNTDLPLHQIQAGYKLRDRVLDL